MFEPKFSEADLDICIEVDIVDAAINLRNEVREAYAEIERQREQLNVAIELVERYGSYLVDEGLMLKKELNEELKKIGAGNE